MGVLSVGHPADSQGPFALTEGTVAHPQHRLDVYISSNSLCIAGAATLLLSHGLESSSQDNAGLMLTKQYIDSISNSMVGEDTSLAFACCLTYGCISATSLLLSCCPAATPRHQ